MLQAMREGMNSWVMKTVLVILLGGALGGLVLMDTISFWRTGVSRGSVANIAGEELNFVEFDRAYRGNLRRVPSEAAQNPEVRAIVARDTLKEQVRKRLLLKATADSGLFVGDVVAAERVREYLKPLVDQGAMESVALATILQRQQISEAALVDTLRNELAVEIMMSALIVPVTAPQQEVQDWLQYDMETRAGEYIRISDKGFTAEAPDEETLKKFHAEKAGMWMSPEYRSFSVLVLTPEKVLSELEGIDIISDDELKKTYEEHIADYTELDKRTISQAVFGTEEDAKAVFALLKNGTVKTLKEATEKAGKSDVQLIDAEEHTAQSIFPEEISEAVFGFAKDTGAVGPVKSPLGWHVVEITATARGKVTSFDDVKDILRSDWILDNASDPLYSKVSELEDMFAGGASVKEAAEFLNIDFTTMPFLSDNGRGEDGKPHKLVPEKHAQEILGKIFKMDKNEEIKAEVMEMNDGSFISVSLDGVKPTQKIAYETVADDVRQAWMSGEKKKQMRANAEKIADAVRADGKTLAEAAKSFGYNVEKIPVRNRAAIHLAGDGKANIPAEAVTELFALQATGDAATLQAGDDIVVVTLTKRDLPDMGDDAVADAVAQAALSRAMIERGMREDIVTQFLTAVEKKYGVKVNDFSFDKQYGKAAQEEALGNY